MGPGWERQVVRYTYLLVRWKDAPSDEPVELWSELDEQRWEVRKVEVWADGRVGYAVEGEEFGGTHLSLEPLPPNEYIASQPEFEPTEVSRAEFEARWNHRGT
jgi:hypothetical protein